GCASGLEPQPACLKQPAAQTLGDVLDASSAEQPRPLARLEGLHGAPQRRQPPFELSFESALACRGQLLDLPKKRSCPSTSRQVELAALTQAQGQSQPIADVSKEGLCLVQIAGGFLEAAPVPLQFGSV